jgi:hypothetical protein
MNLGEDLLRFNFQQEYLLWDAETCNLNLSHIEIDRPWQWGWEIYKGKNLVESHEDWLLWEDEFTVGEGAAMITGFDWNKYNDKAVDPKPVLKAFEEKLYNPDVISIGANLVGFDVYIHMLFRKLLGKGVDFSYLKNLICIQSLEKAIVLGVKLPKIGTEEWVSFLFKMQNYRQRGLKTSLKALVLKYGIPYDETRHHVEASYDTHLTKEVFNKQIYAIEI